MKKAVFLVIFAVFLLFLGSCSKPTVESVEITTDEGALQAMLQGEPVKFSAEVAGKGDFNKAVTWTVSSTADGTGAVSPATNISPSGVLNVGTDETATALYIRATSNADSNVYDYVQIALAIASDGNIVVEERRRERPNRGERQEGERRGRGTATGRGEASTGETQTAETITEAQPAQTASTQTASARQSTATAASAQTTQTAAAQNTTAGGVQMPLRDPNLAKRLYTSYQQADNVWNSCRHEWWDWQTVGDGSEYSRRCKICDITFYRKGNVAVATAENCAHRWGGWEDIGGPAVKECGICGSILLIDTNILTPAQLAANEAAARQAAQNPQPAVGGGGAISMGTAGTTQTTTSGGSAAQQARAKLLPHATGRYNADINGFYTIIGFHEESGFHWGHYEGADYVYVEHYIGSATSVQVPAQIHGVPVREVRSFGTMSENLNAMFGEVTDRLAQLARITSITIPSGVTVVLLNGTPGGNFFPNLRPDGLILPNTVTTLGPIFRGRADITSLAGFNIPSSVKILEQTFSGTGITSFAMPSHVTRLEDTFAYCARLTSVTLSNGLVEIGERTFLDCSSLANITIPNTVTTIGKGAFVGTKITSLTIPANTVNIRTSGLPNVTTGANSFLSAFPQSLASVTIGSRTIPAKAFADLPNLASVTIQNTVTSIGEGAFSGCEAITSLTVPASVTSIGGRLFVYNRSVNYENRTLASVTIQGAATIGDWAFRNCAAIASVNMPNVVSIGSSAFENTGLSGSLALPPNLRSIGPRAFFGTRITSVTIPASLATLTADSNNLYSPFPQTLASATIQNGATVVLPNLFLSCINLTSVTLPNTITRIGAAAFAGTGSAGTGLASLTLPASLRVIEDGAFGQSHILNLTIPASVSEIGRYVIRDNVRLDPNHPNYTVEGGLLFNKNKTRLMEFVGGTNMRSITIPASVTSVDERIFDGGVSLNSVTFAGTIPASGLTPATFSYMGDLHAKYRAGGPGTYTRPGNNEEELKNSRVWTKR